MPTYNPYQTIGTASSTYSEWTNTNSVTGASYDYWTTTTSGTGNHAIPIGYTYQPQYFVRQYIPELTKVITPEEIQQENECREKEILQLLEKQRQQDIANRKARLLLLEHLDLENRMRIKKEQPFIEVRSKRFNDLKYHIPNSKMGRIKVFKNKDMITELCLLVNDCSDLPIDDVVLTKLLYILNDEENVIRTANHYSQKENLKMKFN